MPCGFGQAAAAEEPEAEADAVAVVEEVKERRQELYTRAHEEPEPEPELEQEEEEEDPEQPWWMNMKRRYKKSEDKMRVHEVQLIKLQARRRGKVIRREFSLEMQKARARARMSVQLTRKEKADVAVARLDKGRTVILHGRFSSLYRDSPHKI